MKSTAALYRPQRNQIHYSLPVFAVVVVLCQTFAFTSAFRSSTSWQCSHPTATDIQRRRRSCPQTETPVQLFATKKGFGSGAGFGASKPSTQSTQSINKKNKNKRGKPSLKDQLQDNNPSESSSNNIPYRKADNDRQIDEISRLAGKTAIGQAVRAVEEANEIDPFWELMPSLIYAKYPMLKDSAMERVAGMVRFAVTTGSANGDPMELLEDSIIQDPYRPHDEIHAYMPGLGETQPFRDPSDLPLCQELSDNYDIIKSEYEALVQDAENRDRFQSVTSMNYESGWKTLVLFYNGHRIEGFPYHLCPVTTRIMESVPLAGRIAGFNRQQPRTGIPLHSDGNNMWLTCQMGIQVPDGGESAWIRVGPEKRYWQDGECLLYDTTYEHETFNENPEQERVVLHIDFFNTLSMTPVEIEVMRYIYQMREQYMKAEGVEKVGAQIL